jgi:DNA-binding response OmpR family regulator
VVLMASWSTSVRAEVTRDCTPVELTAHEFMTLQFFVQNPDRVITRAELVKQVCGYGDGYTSSRSIDNHVMKLHHKFGEGSRASDPFPNSISSWV